MNLILLALVGCRHPITNVLFYEDEEFLSALPAEQLEIADALTDAEPGASAEFEISRLSALDLENRLDPLRASFAAVRAASPTERSSESRSWNDLTAASETVDGAQLWHLRADIVKDGDQFTWTIEAAPEAESEYGVVVSGASTSEAGHLVWNGEVGATLLAPAFGDLAVDWSDTEAEFEALDSESRPEGRWQRLDAHTFTWEGPTAVNSETWPGFSQMHHESEGGWIDGIVQTGSGEQAFQACWDAGGTAIWQAGWIANSGNLEDCPVPPEE